MSIVKMISIPLVLSLSHYPCKTIEIPAKFIDKRAAETIRIENGKLSTPL